MCRSAYQVRLAQSYLSGEPVLPMNQAIAGASRNRANTAMARMPGKSNLILSKFMW